MTDPTVAVDTSVAVPLLVATHEAHAQVSAWARNKALVLAGHALAETYSVLTRLPGDLRVEPADAVRLIDASFGESVLLPDSTAASLHHVLADLGVAGGAVYDGIIGLAAAGDGMPLATRDARAKATYEAVGATTEIV